MATATDIANMALTMALTGTIGNINDATRNASVCRTSLPLAKGVVFRQYDWNCLQKRAALAKLADVPVFGFANTFKLPEDFMRLSKVSFGRSHKWKVEGRNLLTDAPSVSILYVADTEDYTVLTSDLMAALAAKLAVIISPTVNTKVGVARDCEVAYKEALGNAIASDSAEVSPDDAIDANDWVNARHGNADTDY